MTPEEQLADKWQIHKVIQEALEKAHNTPAPATLKKLEEITKRMDENYSKRELDEHFNDVKKSIEEIKKLGTAIDAKVGIQNGRVTKSETWIKTMVVAGSTAFFLVGVIGGLVVYSFQLSQENLKNTILLEVRQPNDKMAN